MAMSGTEDRLLRVLRATMVSLSRGEQRDLSARQMAVMLICYGPDGDQTVRGLAAMLGLAKPAVTRALDRLADLDLLRRQPDPRDRRSVLTRCTPKGAGFMRQLQALLIAAAAGSGRPGPSKSRRKPPAR